MIALLHVGVDIRFQDAVREIVGHINVIDAPSLVVQSHGRKALAPPAVAVRLGMQAAEAVGPSARKERIHPGALRRQESR